MSEVTTRPLDPGDAEAAAAIAHESFAALDQAAGRVPEDPTDRERRRWVDVIARFPETDPQGCWVAEDGDEIVGISSAIRRGGFWGLALLFIAPDRQAHGLGRRLLEAARRTAEGATFEAIMSSDDPRALRRYAALGLRLHPTMAASGEVDRAALPGGLAGRDAGRGELALVDEVDADVRGAGASRADDVAFMLKHGARLRVVDTARSEGYVVAGERGPFLLGARTLDTARDLLWWALAGAEEPVRCAGLTATHSWAIDVALAARLQLAPSGPLFLRGRDAPPEGWLPSGVYF